MAIGYNETLKRLREGDRTMVTHPNPEGKAEKISYGLVSAGLTVSALAYRKLLPDLEPAADGLFGVDEGPQTFALRSTP